MGVSELNGRETLTWAMVKLSNSGYLSDDQVWTQLKADPGLDLGDDYDWPFRNPGPPGRRYLAIQKRDIRTQLTETNRQSKHPARWLKM